MRNLLCRKANNFYGGWELNICMTKFNFAQQTLRYSCIPCIWNRVCEKYAHQLQVFPSDKQFFHRHHICCFELGLIYRQILLQQVKAWRLFVQLGTRKQTKLVWLFQDQKKRSRFWLACWLMGSAKRFEVHANLQKKLGGGAMISQSLLRRIQST